MQSISEWCVIESDPGVFSELAELCGVKNVVFEELLDIGDLQNLAKEQKIFGYIFLSKHSERSFGDGKSYCSKLPSGILFPKQVVHNACATVAMLSILLNNEGVEIGEDLSNLKHFCTDATPEMQGIGIMHSDFIRTAHNSFKGNSSFEMIHCDEKGKEDAFHFISYIPYKGEVYELDGLQELPLCIGTYEGDGWHEVVQKRVLENAEYIQAGNSGWQDIRFNLMAAIEDPRKKLEAAIKVMKQTISNIDIKLISFGLDIPWNEEMDEESVVEGAPSIEELPDTIEELQSLKLNSSVALELTLKQKAAKAAERDRWNTENAIRRHDWTPFILHAMRILARKKVLKSLYFKAEQQLMSQQNGSSLQ